MGVRGSYLPLGEAIFSGPLCAPANPKSLGFDAFVIAMHWYGRNLMIQENT